jgi:hypothetical protein
MIIGRPRIATVDVAVPSVAIDDVAAFVPSARSWTLMHRNGGWIDVLFLDVVETGILRGIGGCVCGREADRRLSPFYPWLASLVGCGHGGVEGGEVTHHSFVLVLLVCVYGLSMLT